MNPDRPVDPVDVVDAEQRVAGYVVLALFLMPERAEPARFVVGRPDGFALPIFATWEEANDAGNALEARGFIHNGVAPVVAINDPRLPG